MLVAPSDRCIAKQKAAVARLAIHGNTKANCTAQELLQLVTVWKTIAIEELVDTHCTHQLRLAGVTPAG